MAKAPKYSEVVQEAEQSVQGVKDPELRRIAFEKVLEELLGGSVAHRMAQKKSTAHRSAKTSRKTTNSGPMSYIREMIQEGFFKKPKDITEVKVELENRGHHIPLTSLSGPLQRLCKQKELRRQRNEGRFLYANW